MRSPAHIVTEEDYYVLVYSVTRILADGRTRHRFKKRFVLDYSEINTLFIAIYFKGLVGANLLSTRCTRGNHLSRDQN